jgi:ATP-dependent RNA helicase DDX54/DBP10
VLEGRDVVAMARTGSGKTACFLIPMFEKLKMRSAKAGARALILSPTRELALQTLKFIKELGRFVGLKSSVILGGDSMDDQFSAIHGNPDVIVATPGRFLHVCIEMELKLSSIEYVVLDEADRLYEMGLGEQLTEIVARLPDARQTVLFSATLPKVLVEFAKAGLNDPVLLRLDVESKIPEELQLWYVTVRPEERVAALLVLLKSHIDSEQQTVVFAATRHHVEYLHMILDRVGLSNTYIYSNLDPSARKINAAKFSTGKVKVLVVTDVAARGIDIPQLDNVINYNFPAKSKLFVHRVGRCARAGRSGTAYSLVTPDEYPYLLDLHLFLGRPLTIATKIWSEASVGRIPQALLEEQHGALLSLHETNADLVSMRTVTENAYKQYVRSRPAASSDSNRRIKELPFLTCGIHPIFRENEEYVEEERENLLDKMKNYRPQGTIFEICGKNKSQEYQVMKQKRSFHKDKINTFHDTLEQKENEAKLLTNKSELTLPKSSSEDIDDAFDKVILPKKRKFEDLYKKNKRQKSRDDNFIPYLPADRHTEEGLAVNNFQNEASKVQLDLTCDSEEGMRRSTQMRKWDRKKKKMVTVQVRFEKRKCR